MGIELDSLRRKRTRSLILLGSWVLHNLVQGKFDTLKDFMGVSNYNFLMSYLTNDEKVKILSESGVLRVKQMIEQLRVHLNSELDKCVFRYKCQEDERHQVKLIEKNLSFLIAARLSGESYSSLCAYLSLKYQRPIQRGLVIRVLRPREAAVLKMINQSECDV